jgi:mannose-6-phosphate isomerase-like protein (cupin superfamily)
MTAQTWHFSLADAHAAVEAARPEHQAAYPFRHGSMRIGLYAPKGEDPQSPHDQDELYIVASGIGMFVKGRERIRFAPADVLFVEAGAAHRFEDFSDDLALWVIFWGLKGGETGQAG